MNHIRRRPRARQDLGGPRRSVDHSTEIGRFRGLRERQQIEVEIEVDRLGDEERVVGLGERGEARGNVVVRYGEPTRLGKRINQVHIKNGPKLMRDTDILDWPRLAQEYHDIGYHGWFVLETDAPTSLIDDTSANIDYVRKTFRMPE